MVEPTEGTRCGGRSQRSSEHVVQQESSDRIELEFIA